MSNDKAVDRERDPILLRLELYLEGNTIQDGEISLSRVSDVEPAFYDALTSDQLVETACRIYESRRLRTRYLSASLLGEPAWDMLLALYCYSARGEKLSVSGLCFAADVPQSTALRWLRTIEGKQLIERTRDFTDGRRIYVKLTDKGEELMRKYLARIHQTGGV